MEFEHVPVLFNEVMDALDIKPDGIYVDGTVGGGGHSEGICRRLTEGGMLIAVDRDREALAAAEQRLAGYGWTVSGLSAITIANKTLYYHGVAAAAKAGDPSGAFALDGEPLVPNTVATGVTGYTLMTAQSRVLVKPTSSGGYITGFTAKYPDGSTATFSCEGTGAAYAYSFPIRQIENVAGEKMTFTYLPYADNDNLYYIDEIRYGYRSGSYKASVKFSYTETTPSCTQYFGGIGLQRSKLLSSIAVKDGSTTLYSKDISFRRS